VYRSVHGLCKVTVDVPTQFAEALREHARELRRMAGEPPTEFDPTLEQGHIGAIGAPYRLTPKEAAESYVMSMRWTRVARGVHFLHRPRYWVTAEVTKLPQKHDPQLLWSWSVKDNRSNQTIAQGNSIDLGRAKEMTIAVVKSYLENEEYFSVRFAHLESYDTQ
jgi:hypothetical protein